MTSGSDGLVGDLLQYGGSGMVYLLEQLFGVVWQGKVVTKEGDKEEPGNYRGMTLLSVVGKVFCKILNNRLVEHLQRESIA